MFHLSLEPSVNMDAPKDGQEIARNVEAFKNRLRGRGGRQRGRGKRQVSMSIDGWGGRESQSNSEYLFLPSWHNSNSPDDPSTESTARRHRRNAKLKLNVYGVILSPLRWIWTSWTIVSINLRRIQT